MLNIDHAIRLSDLLPDVDMLFSLSKRKLLDLLAVWDFTAGSPVCTRRGVYESRGWTEWTMGFFFGSAALQYDHDGDERFLRIARDGAVGPLQHLTTHTGVHDHGFNVVSTYGNLYRMHREGKLPVNAWEKEFYAYALRVSGGVQAQRWTELGPDAGFIHSFNGPHSLFVDTMRSLRSLALAWQLGHEQAGEGEKRIDLFRRLVQHAAATAGFNVYHGEGRDAYDVRGRVAHETIFNVKTGAFRCPSTQQGYSPFSTWMRGLAWALLGFAEQLEFLHSVPESRYPEGIGKEASLDMFLRAVLATADFYLANTTVDGVPFWDTGAPGLAAAEHLLAERSDPFNGVEPLDSSAAVIAAQGLIRLGNHLKTTGNTRDGDRCFQAGLTVARTIMRDPYLSRSESHQGLILHSVYHRPAGWDHVPEGGSIPCGESSLWGDYHALELGFAIERLHHGIPYAFFIPD